MDRNQDNGQKAEISQVPLRPKNQQIEDFVLEKGIFSNVFEKDIQKVFIYKKVERLAKAVHLIAPAFVDDASLRDRLAVLSVRLIDAGVLASPSARTTLSRELLTLSSILALARTTGLLSAMNADLISREAQFLLQEVSAYEEPRLLLEDAPTLAQMMKTATGSRVPEPASAKLPPATKRAATAKPLKTKELGGRRESVLSVIKDKKVASIKDISTHITSVSEKTLQRELQALVADGLILKKGDRRWSTYSLA